MSRKENNNYLKDPHDKFFESTFRETAIAKDHLESVLPAELLKVIDLNSLKLDSKSYIDDSLKRYFSDVAYSADCPKTGTVLKVTFLYEHKSYTMAHPHLQLLQYMLNIWQTVEKDGKNDLFPVVIPLIVYHGEKEWNLQPFTSYFGNTSQVFSPYIPSFEYILSDCAKYSIEELKEHRFKSAALKLVMYLFKTIFDLEKMEKDFDFFLNSLILILRTNRKDRVY